MQKILDQLIGPVPENYCMYFQLLTIIAIIWIVILTLNLLYGLFSKKKQDNMVLLGGLFVYLMMYLQNRILNTMCTKTL